MSTNLMEADAGDYSSREYRQRRGAVEDVRALHSDEQTIRAKGNGPRRHFEVCRDECHVASTIEESPLVLRFFKSADQDMGYTLRNTDVHYVEGLHHIWKCEEKEVNWTLNARPEAEPRMDVRAVYCDVSPHWTKPVDHRQPRRLGYMFH
jgi:hypothetical protein